MAEKIRTLIRQQWAGLIALFLVLSGGTALATHPGGTNTIDSTDIIDNEVKTQDVRDGNITRDDIRTGAVVTEHIATGAVQSIDVLDNNLTGDDIAESTLTGLWQLGGNAGTTGSNFLGTTDNQPLNLRVNNARGLRLEPASDGTNQSPNVIGGIADNAVTAGVHSATISGGGRQFAGNSLSANLVTDNFGTIGGGANNEAGDNDATLTDATFATVGGGVSNTASGLEATVGGGEFNTASGFRATVGGGFGNDASGDNPTVGGGEDNEASAGDATVGGGDTNTASGGGATVGGGGGNEASGDHATVGGGSSNTASGLAATVPGGNDNDAAGDYSLVAGRRAKNTDATHDGVFLFADSGGVSGADFASVAANEFAVRASGGFRFRTNAGLTTGCNLPAGTGTFSCTSDREAKSGFAAVEPRQVLAQLAGLPIRSWVYEDDPSGVRHIGPTSQAFIRAFGIGEDPRAISAVDADGIALAAIQGLNERVEALQEGGGASRPESGSGVSISPAALAAVAALGAALAAALGAALALRWSARPGRRMAMS